MKVELQDKLKPQVGDLVYGAVKRGYVPGGPLGAGVGVYRVKMVAKLTDSFKVEHVSGYDTWGGNRTYNKIGEFFYATYTEAHHAVREYLLKQIQNAEAEVSRARDALKQFEEAPKG